MQLYILTLYYIKFSVFLPEEFVCLISKYRAAAEIKYKLSKEPQRIDILVVVKELDVQIENEVGKFFKQHNVIEYKSPDGRLCSRIREYIM